MAIQTVVFFICFLFLVFLIIIPIFHGRNIIVFEIAGKAWWVSSISWSYLYSFWSKTKSNNCLLSFPSLWSVTSGLPGSHWYWWQRFSMWLPSLLSSKRKLEQETWKTGTWGHLLYCNVVSWSGDIDLMVEWLIAVLNSELWHFILNKWKIYDISALFSVLQVLHWLQTDSSVEY